MTAANIVLCAIRDPGSPLPVPSTAALEAIERHALAPVAWHRLAEARPQRTWDEALQMSLRNAAAAQAIRLKLLDADLGCVLGTFAAARVRTVVIKGAALARTCYRRAYLRPRTDTDLVIRAADRDAATRILVGLGYERMEAVDGDLVTRQFQWTRKLAGGVFHTLDVHWELFNPHVFANVLPTEALLARAVPLPGLGTPALAPHPVHALLIACVHRVAHHAHQDDLLWTYDIHLLASALDPEDAREFVGLASARGVAAICIDGLQCASERFGGDLPRELQEWMRFEPGRGEATAGFVDAARRQVGVLLSDIQALHGPSAKLRLLGQHLFPSPAYMRQRYGLHGRLAMPWLYGRRILTGLPRWLRRR